MRRTYFYGVVGLLAIGTATVAACSATTENSSDEPDDGEDGTTATTGGAGGTGGTTTTGMGAVPNLTVTVSGVGGGTTTTCDSAPDDDSDSDGFTVTEGDCNDCDANVNPGAIEVIVTMAAGDGGVPEAADEDCDGMVDNVAPPCDATIDYFDMDPYAGAKALGLCNITAPGGPEPGVISALYTRADGSPLSFAVLNIGVLPGFGPNVNTQEGARMVALSSGTARTPDQMGYVNHTYSNPSLGAGTAPPGFPQDVPGCPGLSNINDDVGFELNLRAPTNATGYKFKFKFYSNEYPEYVCTSFNNQFIALVDPAPMGSLGGNISFDSGGNPVSVNVAFFDVCSGCALGTAELDGTGFGAGEGGTSWLETQAPIGPGEEFSIRYAIWDTGDSAFDSTVLIDGFEWIANGGTVAVGTVEVPTPR